MASSQEQWIAYTDGACRGNPGKSGAGVLLISPEGQEFRLYQFLGTKTNNQAEYEAMIYALESLLQHNAKQVLLRADSELMIKQMNGIYRVKNDNVIPLFQKANQLRSKFNTIEFEHVRREFNKTADQLANLAIDDAEEQ